ncbi:NTF2 domain-containing protein [Salix suchowensis]|nr:NTF2 domain-containing protein [Salix suchowensis]
MFRGPSSTQNGACRPHRGRGIWPNPTRRTHGEDTQPNEIIDKRRTTVPPAIRTISTASKYTKPQWRGRGRDNPYLGRGRGTRFGFAPALHFRGTPGCNESVSSANSHLTQRPSLNSASDAPSLSTFSTLPDRNSFKSLCFAVGNRDLATQDRTVQIRHGDHALQNDITSTFTTSPNLYITPGLSEDRPTKRRRIEEGQSASCFGDTVSQLPTQPAHSFQGWIKRESLSPPPRPALSRPDPTTPIKNEARSPSPSPAVKRLVTSGCIRYTPMPMNCRRLDPMYKFHRKEWARNEVAILKTKGLRTTRWFAREDGMVIEWYAGSNVYARCLIVLHLRSSRIPVWSDTLEPEVSPEPPPIPDISPAPHQLHYDDRANTTALPRI